MTDGSDDPLAGIADDSGTAYSDLTIRVNELGGSTLVSSSQKSDPVGYNVQGATTLIVEVENQTGSDLIVGGYADFEIEFDTGPDDIGRTEIALTDIRDTVNYSAHLVHVPSTDDAEITRAGVHDESGNVPSGLSLTATRVGGSDIFTTTAKSDIINQTVQGPADILVQIENQTGSDGTFGGFTDVTLI